MMCHGWHLINALDYLRVVRSDGLGKRSFGAVGEGSSRSSSTTYPFRLCPNLRTLSMRYSYLICDGEHGEITLLLHGIIEPRQKTGVPLQNVKFLATKDITDEQEVELCRPAKNVDREN